METPAGAAREGSREIRLPLRSGRRRSLRRAAPTQRSFSATMRGLEGLAGEGARVSLRVTDLDHGGAVVTGDAGITYPIATLGTVPLLIEVAAGFASGRLDRWELVDRDREPAVSSTGLWQHLAAPALPLVDLAVLTASSGDALAANALLRRVGIDAVQRRIRQLGLGRTAILDRQRDDRGPDDAPHFALGTAEEFAGIFESLVNESLVDAGVSAQVIEWLGLNHDLGLVASATGFDPFSLRRDDHGLLLVDKTGRDDGVRAEAGVMVGPHAGVAYALIVCFDDLSILHRLRVHDAFRTLGIDLMEYVY